MRRFTLLHAVAAGAMLVATGCPNLADLKSDKPPEVETADEKPDDDSGEKSGSILKKKTQDIGRYDPSAGLEVSDLKVRATTPGLAALEAYGPMVGKVSTAAVDQQVAMFEIENNHYPTYEEFMEQIVKRYNVELPVLPGKAKYQYDEANHRLVVVAPPEDAAK